MTVPLEQATAKGAVGDVIYFLSLGIGRFGAWGGYCGNILGSCNFGAVVGRIDGTNVKKAVDFNSAWNGHRREHSKNTA